MEWLAGLEWLSALIPPVADGIRGLIGKWTGGAGARPQNVDEVIKLEQASTERLKALAALDEVKGQISIWVANIRALQRPFAVFFVLLAYAVFVLMGAPPEVQAQVASFAQMAVFYLFGERGYRYMKKGG